MNVFVSSAPAPSGKGRIYHIGQARNGTVWEAYLTEREAKSLVSKLIRALPPQPFNITVSKKAVTAVTRGLKMRRPRALATITLPLSEDIMEDGTLHPGARDPNKSGFCDPPVARQRLPPLVAVMTKKGVKIRPATRVRK